MNEPKLAKITINLNSSSPFGCGDWYKIKSCYVSKYHFNRNEFGIYNTNHLNHLNEYSPYYDSSLINVILPFQIYINQEDNPNRIVIGYNGIIYLKSDYNDKEKNIFNDSNIEENTKFNAYIKYDNIDTTFRTPCHFWKNTENIIFIFCYLNRNLSIGANKFMILARPGFPYNNLEVHIEFNSYVVNVFQLQGSFPFLYSKNQTINIEEGTDTYYLKFNIKNYQNEKLILVNEPPYYIFLDECSTEKKELICKIGKSELEEIPLSRIKPLVYYPSSEDKGPLIQLPMIG